MRFLRDITINNEITNEFHLRCRLYYFIRVNFKFSFIKVIQKLDADTMINICLTSPSIKTLK